jgi:Domain of unknown function (DUF389)
MTVQFLDTSPAVTYLWVSEGNARKPSGDVVSFDVAREGATSIFEALRGFGLDRQGAIVVENLDISISKSAIMAEEETPGEPADAVVWEDLEQSAGEETRLSVTYLCFMIVVTMIAGIGVALTSAKSGALVGVLISVTTIPAAANAAVAIAYWVPSEAIGSAIQLVINLSAIAVAGTLTLLVLRARAEQLARRSPARIAQ